MCASTPTKNGYGYIEISAASGSFFILLSNRTDRAPGIRRGKNGIQCAISHKCHYVLCYYSFIVSVTIKAIGGNYILDSLEEAEIRRLISKLELIQFKLGDVVYESGDKMEYAYF